VAAWLLLVAPFLTAGQDTLVSAFPELKGWQKGGQPDLYQPDNLFEYINGAAEVFLSYDFQLLATLSYQSEKNQSITVDIYEHRDTDSGFGIYSQEKPLVGEFIPIGTQGYYESGTLNFFRNKYYVKLSGYDLGQDDRSSLETFAKEINQRLTGDTAFPDPVHCFPVESKLAHSEKYIAQNFLGHRFLHSAFVADYLKDEKKFQIFIIAAASEDESQAILDGYMKFLAKKGIETTPGQDGIYRFTDPYYRSSGRMNLKKQGMYIWGLFENESAQADLYIKQIASALREKDLIHD
jgi:hypothetical protein